MTSSWYRRLAMGLLVVATGVGLLSVLLGCAGGPGLWAKDAGAERGSAPAAAPEGGMGGGGSMSGTR